MESRGIMLLQFCLKGTLGLSLMLVCFSIQSIAQNLKPGFDKLEYKELMLISSRTSANAAYYADLPEPSRFSMNYRSGIIGLDNLWDLWLDSSSTAVISIRGTTTKQESWLANFYAAMVPAKGELKLEQNRTFQYDLANHPKAAVHVGWLLSMAYLADDIQPRIDSCYKVGYRNFILMGHSQGGAIAFLLNSHIKSLQNKGEIPSDIQLKTYCSAGPKPGNLFYAYDYEFANSGGWAFNVVNAADWVPQTPISIQTLNDFNTTNPFVNAKKLIRKMPFPKDLVFRKVFNKLDKPTRKAQRNFEKYLGNKTEALIEKNLAQFSPPQYAESNDYVRTGVTIVLMPDEEYYQLYPDQPEKIFIHHFHRPYLYLLEKLDNY